MELTFDLQQQLDQTALQVTKQIQSIKSESFQLEELLRDILNQPGAGIASVTTQLNSTRQLTNSGMLDTVGAVTCAIVGGINQQQISKLAERRNMHTLRSIDGHVLVYPISGKSRAHLRLDGVNP
ncbi:hypothetical protein HA052_22455 [Chromobacterium haemolyticum]|uniref:Uncharacterized protein n=1 Tax=Chromobacterium fluminis TaxID=3044269 RepID=A0ABX0L8K2_9NEIS|nr:hypothetical protein [Chromobacterium haemolyticum]NHR07954.1 hypothetical protein [Chromobacterium haemolyticum]